MQHQIYENHTDKLKMPNKKQILQHISLNLIQQTTLNKLNNKPIYLYFAIITKNIIAKNEY
jgi:hypothetical protein